MIARILVVDDNPDIRALLRDHLRSESHEVLEASDGAQAFMMAEKHVPHLIIMDIIMPGIYGTSATKLLQDYWRTSKIPIVIISGSTDVRAFKWFSNAENVRFLKKPIDLRLLDQTIRELLPKGGYTQ